MTDLWKTNWDETRRRFHDWWRGKGFIIGSWAGVRRSQPHATVEDPGPAGSLEQQWCDLDWRARAARHQASWTDWPLETLPVADPWLGPGSLALYVGAEPDFMPETVWYKPCIPDPEAAAPISFDPRNRWWRFQLELFNAMHAAAQGNYFIGCPDMVENWDVLASLRGAEELLSDMLDRPAWVKRKLEEMQQAWCAAYTPIHAAVQAQDGETMFGWFRVCAPGKVAKVQCDGASMFSPAMFREFVVPTLAQQCRWLDYSIFHLDGSQCLCHLDELLAIEQLSAIEWTPEPRVPTGGSPHWYDLYRRILGAGKRVQVLGAHANEIEPLLDAVGTDGIYFLSFFGNEAEAEAFARVAERARSRVMPA